MYEMATNVIPFAGLTSIQIPTAVLIQGKRPNLPNDYDGRLKKLVENCWKSIPSERPKSIDIMANLEMLMDEQPNREELICEKLSISLDLLENENWNSDKTEVGRILELKETDDIMNPLTIEYQQVKEEILNKMNGEKNNKYEIMKCSVIDNKELWNSFKEKLILTHRMFYEDSEKLNLNTWGGNKEGWRDWMKDQLDIFIRGMNPYLVNFDLRVIPLFYMIGKNENIGLEICDKGFGVLEDEWLGKGVYFSNNLNYEIEKKGISKGDEFYVMISFILLGNSYPVVEDPKDTKQSMKGKPPKVKQKNIFISKFDFFREKNLIVISH